MNTDRTTVQMVVAFIGLSSVLIVSGLIFLAYEGRQIPEQLSTMGGATIGALGSLLARTFTSEGRSGDSAALPVEIKNSPESPVPVAQADTKDDEETRSSGG